MTEIRPLTDLRPERFDRPDILKRLATTSRQLAELKGVASSMPNQAILIDTLGLQEAKDSSEIENIVTTHDELFRDAAFPEAARSDASKEVARYRQALRIGFEAVCDSGLLTNDHILDIQAELLTAVELRLLVHRHRLQRRKLLRPPCLLPGRKRSIQSTKDHAQSRNQRRSLGQAEQRYFAIIRQTEIRADSGESHQAPG